MPGKPIRIGPFIGGLNNISMAGEAEDEELVELINMEVGLDSALTSRPPMEVMPSTTKSLGIRWKVLGTYRDSNDVWYLIVVEPKTATTIRVNAYLSGDLTAAPIVIKDDVAGIDTPSAYVQYVDWGYFCIRNEGSTGFRWKPVINVENVADMPNGEVMIAWNDRLWVTGTYLAVTGNHVYFSTVDKTGPQPTKWDRAVDFFRVDPGYGGFNTALLSLGNSLYIFKSDATYRFSYPTAPENGSVDKVSGSVGAAGRDSVIAFDNFCYIYDQGRVYELINNNFNQINLNVEFRDDPESVDNPVSGVELSSVNRRLIIRYSNALYVYTVDTRSWSQWRCAAGTPGLFIEVPSDSSLAAPSQYIAASVGEIQSIANNQIKDSSFADEELLTRRLSNFNNEGTVNENDLALEVSTAGYFYLSNDGSSDDYHIPVGSGQIWDFTVNVTSATQTVAAPIKLAFNYLHRDGSTSKIEQSYTDVVGVKSISRKVPDGAILMNAGIYFPVGDYSIQKGISVDKENNPSPANLIKLMDEYQNTTAVEYMECFLKTKSYDYQANSVFKRLFWWGVDLKTPRVIELKAIPLGRVRSVTWNQLEDYTWDQLEAGTWDNPLSWLNESNTITDISDPNVGISENGRFFYKAPKSLRFRQIQFSIATSSLGNIQTGPVKLYSMTTYVLPKEKVVDTAT